MDRRTFIRSTDMANHAIALAIKHRLPAMAFRREAVLAGVLMSYGPSFADACRIAAVQVDKLLKGTSGANARMSSFLVTDPVSTTKSQLQGVVGTGAQRRAYECSFGLLGIGHI